MKFIKNFFAMEAASGIFLMFCATVAIILANGSFSPYYQLLISTPVAFNLGDGLLNIDKPLLLWINDGLMAVFFFLIGLELKRELLEGELADKRNIILPGIGAVGGMVVPALVYLFFNYQDPNAVSGWAIPAATDIAFALAVLSMLGSRVPISIKVFLTSLAIFDDIGAIIIIAVFYTSNLSANALAVAVLCIPVLYMLNQKSVEAKSPYMLIGAIMWIALLKSGVHATLAGVLVAMFIPNKSKNDPKVSPLKNLEKDLHHIVAYFVLPVFAFANSGIDFRNMSQDQVLHNVPIGIALGLFLGKQLGIFAFSWAFIKMKVCNLPVGSNWGMFYGASILGGIGFTMSLFIGSLAFNTTDMSMIFDERLGIIVGSLASGIMGFLVLKMSLNVPVSKTEAYEQEVPLDVVENAETVKVEKKDNMETLIALKVSEEVDRKVREIIGQVMTDKPKEQHAGQLFDLSATGTAHPVTSNQQNIASHPDEPRLVESELSTIPQTLLDSPEIIQDCYSLDHVPGKEIRKSFGLIEYIQHGVDSVNDDNYHVFFERLMNTARAKNANAVINTKISMGAYFNPETRSNINYVMIIGEAVVVSSTTETMEKLLTLKQKMKSLVM